MNGSSQKHDVSGPWGRAADEGLVESLGQESSGPSDRSALFAAGRWSEFFSWARPQLREVWLSGLAHLHALQRSGQRREPVPRGWSLEEEAAVQEARRLMLVQNVSWLGEAPSRIQCEFMLVTTTGDLRSESFRVDPQRAAFGTAAFLARAERRIHQLSTPFGGELKVVLFDERSKARLTARAWSVEIAGGEGVTVAELRAVVHDLRRSLSALRGSHRDRERMIRSMSKEMVRMFGESASVISASAEFVEEIAGIGRLAERPEDQPGALDDLLKALAAIVPELWDLMRTTPSSVHPAGSPTLDDPWEIITSGRGDSASEEPGREPRCRDRDRSPRVSVEELHDEDAEDGL